MENGKNDQKWTAMYKSYMKFMEKNKRRPSKYYDKERVFHNWFKHNKKLLNKGEMPDYRIGLFKRLLDEATKYQRLNQHMYVNGMPI